MEINLSNTDHVTPEKAEFVEEQANRLLQFTWESREILRREAHTTLNWLFAIVVGASGYVVTLLRDAASEMWLIVPLAIAVAIAGAAAIALFLSALRLEDVLPRGNEPKNLVTDELMSYDVHWIRLAEACQLQERIEKTRAQNNHMGHAINSARWFVVLIPPSALMLGLIVRWISA